MEPEGSYNDTLLFLQVAEGSEVAFTEIFKRYSPRLYAHILRLVKSEHLAKEFVQETFLRLWLNREKLADIRLPHSWLYRVAANLALEHLRAEATHNNLQSRVYEKLRPAEFPVTDRVEERELALIIHQAVDALPEKRREVYRLSREEGLSHQQIADKLGIAVVTVKTHMGLAVKSIREYLHARTGLSLAVLAFILSQ